jgi:hypothetical protein
MFMDLMLAGLKALQDYVPTQVADLISRLEAGNNAGERR